MNFIKTVCEATLANKVEDVRNEVFSMARADGCVGPLVLSMIAQSLMGSDVGIHGVDHKVYSATKQQLMVKRAEMVAASATLPVAMKERLSVMNLTRPVRGETLLDIIMDSEEAFTELGVSAMPKGGNQDLDTTIRIVSFWHPELDAETVRNHAEQIEALG